MEKYPATAMLEQFDAFDRAASALMAPFSGAIDRSPLSPASKQGLKTRPIGWMMDAVDAPMKSLLEDIVNGATAYSGKHEYAFPAGMVARLDAVQPGDELYSPDALTILRSLRTMNAYMILTVRDPRAFGVGWVRALEKRGKNAVEKVTAALSVASQLAQAGMSAAAVQEFTQGVREAAGGAFQQGVNTVKSGVDAAAQNVRDFLRNFGVSGRDGYAGLGGEPVATAVISGLIGLATTAFLTAGTITTAIVGLLGKIHTEATQRAMASASAQERSDLINRGILSPGMTLTPKAAGDLIPGVPNLALAAGVVGLAFMLVRK